MALRDILSGSWCTNVIPKRAFFTWVGDEPLPWMRQDKPVAHIPNEASQAVVTDAITDAAVDFIRRHKDDFVGVGLGKIRISEDDLAEVIVGATIIATGE